MIMVSLKYHLCVILPKLRLIMHDGRFAILADVIEHYDSGVQAHPNLDNRQQRNGVPRQLNLSDQDKTDLIAFLQTLTDDVFLTKEKFSDPFR